MHPNLLRALSAASSYVERLSIVGYVQLVSTSEPDAHTLRLWFIQDGTVRSIDARLSVEAIANAQWPDEFGVQIARHWVSAIRRPG